MRIGVLFHGLGVWEFCFRVTTCLNGTGTDVTDSEQTTQNVGCKLFLILYYTAEESVGTAENFVRKL